MVIEPISSRFSIRQRISMEGGMPDYATLRTKDLGQEALSADSVRGNARAKAIRASYEFWSTGDEALLEQAFAEIFAEHAVRPLCEPVERLDDP
jgi:hypothetical protein